MATTDLSTLRVNVIAQTRDFQRGMDRVRRETRSTSDEFATMRRQMLAATAAVTGLSFLAKKMFDVGAAVEETASKYRTVFGPAVNQTNEFIRENARLMGLTTQEAQELLATTGAVVQGFGATKQASAGLSQSISTLAADIASFNNAQGGAEQVTRDIIGALGSEREALKKYGIVITETMVQQRAMAMTGKENAKALNQLDKALASVQLISEKAGVAVGDLARTQDSAANRARKVGAAFRELRDDIATGLMPSFAELLGIVEDTNGGLAEMGDTFRAQGQRIAAWVRVFVEGARLAGDALNAINAAAQDLGEAFRLALLAAANEFVGELFVILNAPVKAINLLLDTLDKIPKIDIDFRLGTLDADKFLTRAQDFASQIGGKFGDAKKELTDLADGFAALMETIEAAKNTGATGEDPFPMPNIDIANALGIQLWDFSASLKEAAKHSKEFKNNAVGDMAEVRRTVESVASSFTGALIDSVTGAKDAFKSFVDFAIRQLLQLAAQFAIFQFLGGGGAGTLTGVGGFFEGLFGFGGKKQHGGSVKGGHTYQVNEHGTEFFRPRGSGEVIPIGGAGASVRLDVSGMPPATNPLAMARDKDWLAFLNASNRELAAGGA